MEGYGNSQFEANAEEGVDLLKEFYMNDVVESERTQLESEALTKPKFTQGGGFRAGYSARATMECEGGELKTTEVSNVPSSVGLFYAC